MLPWAFYINVIVAILVLLVAPFVMTDNRAERRSGLDLPGAILITVALLYGITIAGEHGWTDMWFWGPVLAAAVLFHHLPACGVSHRGAPGRACAAQALNIAWGTFAGLLAFATWTGMVFLRTFYLQRSFTTAQSALA